MLRLICGFVLLVCCEFCLLPCWFDLGFNLFVAVWIFRIVLFWNVSLIVLLRVFDFTAVGWYCGICLLLIGYRFIVFGISVVCLLDSSFANMMFEFGYSLLVLCCLLLVILLLISCLLWLRLLCWLVWIVVCCVPGCLLVVIGAVVYLDLFVAVCLDLVICLHFCVVVELGCLVLLWWI